MEDLGDLLELDFEVIPSKEENPCIGLHFRGRESSFFDPKAFRIVRKTEFYLLKSKSCKGCEKCYWIRDLLHDFDAENIGFPEGLIFNQHTYGLEIKTSRYWESVYEDIDEVNFIEED